MTLDPAVHRTGEYWHVLLPGIVPGQLYGYVAHGPWAPHEGLRFDATKLLLDPYGRGVAVPAGYRRLDAGVVDDMATTMKSVVTDTRLYDWEGDVPLNRPWRETDRLRGAPRRDDRRSRVGRRRPSCAARTPGSSRRSRTSSISG